jgi:transcriptional regulator with XRE-family HTH domain
MTSAAFAAWRARLGITKSETARRLGMSRNSVIAYEAGTQGIPLYVALACAAVEKGLKVKE